MKRNIKFIFLLSLAFSLIIICSACEILKTESYLATESATMTTSETESDTSTNALETEKSTAIEATTVTTSETESAQLRAEFLSVEEGLEAMKPLILETETWEIGTRGNYLFIVHNHCPYVVRYNSDKNEIDRIVKIFDAPSGWYFNNSTKRDGEQHIVEARNIMDGKDMNNRILIDFTNKTVSATEEDDFTRTNLSKGQADGKIVIEDGRYYFYASGGNVKEITSLPPNTEYSAAVVVMEGNRIGAVLPSEKSVEKLGYYKFVVIDISEDKIVQECPMNIE